MKSILSKILIIIISLVVVYFSAFYFGYIYDFIFPGELGSGWIGSDESWFFIRGISISAIFFLAFVFSAFVFKGKLFPVLLLIPILVWEYYIDFAHIYFPIALGIVGWLLGVVVHKLRSR